MKTYNLYRTGSVDDIRSSLRLIEHNATVRELLNDIDLGMKFRGRATVINMINNAISRKLKRKK